MNKRGFIPEQVLIFRQEHPSPLGGTPAFMVRKGCTETALQNARAWATGHHAWLRTPVPDVVPAEASNLPRGGYKVVGAEQRGEGGRAWKVVSPEGDLVDLREDVFLPILLKKGLPASGIIDAEFQWCQNGSQLRLEEVGSKQHGEYQPEAESVAAKLKKKEDQKSKRKKAIPVKDLEIGEVYEFESYSWKEYMVYLGRVRYEGKLRTAWFPRNRINRLREGHHEVATMRTGSQAQAHVKDSDPQVKNDLLANLAEKRALLACWQRGDGLALPDGGHTFDRSKAPLEVEWVD